MKMNRPPILLLLLFFTFAMTLDLTAQGGALHLIASIDHINEDIKEGCEKDFTLANNLFSAIAKDAGMAYNLQRLPFEIDAVSEFIEEFYSGPNDVVVFFYSGHGVRYGEEDEEDWPWPYLYYCEKRPDNDPLDCELDMEWVQEELIGKNPRMTIILGDNCNDVQDDADMNEFLSLLSTFRDDPEPDSDESYSNLDLIRKFRGHIIASAASPGEAAVTNSDGSFFAVHLFHYLMEALTADTPTSWEQIMKKTRDKVNQASNGSQTPQFSVNGRRG